MQKSSKHLPSRLGHLSEVREVVLEPGVNLFQRHAPVFPAVDGKLDHGHVGERRPLGVRTLFRFLIRLCLRRLLGKLRKIKIKDECLVVV